MKKLLISISCFFFTQLTASQICEEGVQGGGPDIPTICGEILAFYNNKSEVNSLLTSSKAESRESILEHLRIMKRQHLEYTQLMAYHDLAFSLIRTHQRHYPGCCSGSFPSCRAYFHITQIRCSVQRWESSISIIHTHMQDVVERIADTLENWAMLNSGSVAENEITLKAVTL